jgi:hypothetical protein
MLQQELHRTSQFAIKLSDKYKKQQGELESAQQALAAASE